MILTSEKLKKLGIEAVHYEDVVFQANGVIFNDTKAIIKNTEQEIIDHFHDDKIIFVNDDIKNTDQEGKFVVNQYKSSLQNPQSKPRTATIDLSRGY